MLCALRFAAAEDAEAPGDCFGVELDPQHPVAIGKITPTKPRVYFRKNVSDDKSCPADTAACQAKAYVIPGDLVLIGKTFPGGADDYSCAVYESAQVRKVSWTKGWLPSASLAPVTPAPARSDWIGQWVHAGGHITIADAANGAVTIQGEAFYDAAQNVHTGVIDATAKPAQGLLQFADDGSIPVDDPKAECQVRMRRVDALLVVEDNNGCGGVMVTFTGFYRRK